jgi:hypothetical protein
MSESKHEKDVTEMKSSTQKAIDFLNEMERNFANNETTSLCTGNTGKKRKLVSLNDDQLSPQSLEMNSTHPKKQKMENKETSKKNRNKQNKKERKRKKNTQKLSQKETKTDNHKSLFYLKLQKNLLS